MGNWESGKLSVRSVLRKVPTRLISRLGSFRDQANGGDVGILGEVHPPREPQDGEVVIQFAILCDPSVKEQEPLFNSRAKKPCEHTWQRNGPPL